VITMTWTDIIKDEDLRAAQKRGIERGVNKTGFCPECKQTVVMFNQCPKSLPRPPIKPGCPMKDRRTSRPRGFPTRFD